MPEDIARLEQRIRYLENVLSSFMYSDKYIFQRHLQLEDGRNISVATGTGTKIGTTTGQKIGFYNTSPIAQRSGSAQTAVSGLADGTYSANEVTLINDIVTLVNELRAALVAIGLIKGSA